MNGMYWYFDTLCKCTTFRGRAGVAEFWVFYLVNLAICVIPFLLSYLVFIRLVESRTTISRLWAPSISILSSNPVSNACNCCQKIA
jgi:uncharacterized membrane protein YhaH (DUF805 family)